MLRSRRSRSRRAGLAERRGGASGRSRHGAPERNVERWLVIGLAAAALVGVGYAWGRWAGGRGRPSVAAPVSPTPAAAALGAASATAEPASAIAALAPIDAPDVAAARPPRSVNAAPVAIVIDDLGRSVEVIDQLRAFGVPLTYAVLPFEIRTAEVAARLAALGEEMLCHLPMEAQRGVDPGPGALDVGMAPRELRASTRKAIEAVPGAIGVNNHMGSALSENREAMAAVLETVHDRGLYFLDSRTSPESVGFGLARELGVPAAERRVFLDGDRAPEAIRREFHRLLALADDGGPAVAIGHPYDETLDVLAQEIPRARSDGYEFVRLSELIGAGGL
jgi:polysaccharide deacetylase 2 family uncharacterized protein YibQ